MGSSPVRGVGAVIFDAAGRVLLIRRARPPLQGAWSIPGGHLEAGEAPAAAAVREVLEETGLAVTASRFLETIQVEAEGYAYAIDEYLCRLVDPAAVPRAGDDASEVRWAAMGELAGLGVSAVTRRLVSTAARVLVQAVGMRENHRCPKCDHNEILFIPQLADRDDARNVRPLVVHVVEFDWRDDVELGKLTAYVCRKCGYTELYTNEAHALPVDKIPGAKLLHGK